MKTSLGFCHPSNGNWLTFWKTSGFSKSRCVGAKITVFIDTHLHFGEMWWKSVLLGKSGALAGRVAQTPTKPMGSIGTLRCKNKDFSVFTWNDNSGWNSRKSWIPAFSRAETEKSWNRMPGWISRKAAKAFGLVKFWGGYYHPGLDFSQNAPF